MLTVGQRAYLVRDQMIGPFVINFLLNAGIGWAAFRHLRWVPVWGNPGAFVDLSVTMFILPVLVCLIATGLLRVLMRAGKLPAFEGVNPSAFPAWATWLPGPLLLRALGLGLLVALLLAPIIAGLFALAGVDRIGLTAFAVLKGVLCGVVASLLSPPIALRAVTDVVDTAEVPAV